MELIDSHLHLDDPSFEKDLAPVIERALAHCVVRLVTIGTSPESWEKTAALSETRDLVSIALGLHPHDASLWSSPIAETLRNLLTQKKAVALGEIGLDYHYRFSPIPTQKHAFRAQIRLARSLGLPLIIHCREADQDTLEILVQEKAQELGGVIHCFTGSEDFAEQCLQMGFFLGFTGIITFRTAEPLRAIVRKTPVSRILIETDSPYLAPVPRRGKRNEPSQVIEVARKIAEIKSASLEQVARETTANARALFKV
ncbi:MAG: TatD family hydrolase [Armatimonadetes bacterium]|nr:TatD family hydrolase [Armatimonadota bacterium]